MRLQPCTCISMVHHADLNNLRIVMSIFGDALSSAEHIGGSMVDGAAHLKRPDLGNAESFAPLPSPAKASDIPADRNDDGCL